MARQALRGIINGLPVTVEADVTAELGPTGIIHTMIEFEDGTPHLRSGDSFTITVPVEVTRSDRVRGE